MSEVVNLAWSNLFVRAHSLYDKMVTKHKEEHKEDGTQLVGLYGVPRGGIQASLILKAVETTFDRTPLRFILVETPEEAEWIVDDIIDSGKTRSHYRHHFIDSWFVALVDKNTDGMKDKWVVFPWERMCNEVNGPEENIRRLIEFIGDNPNRDGLKDTPSRVIRSYLELFSGYKTDPESVFTVFPDIDCDEMVLLKDIEIYSMCEHHMMPFYGKAHVAYIPGEKENNLVVGVSKLARLVEIFSRRLTVQETICEQVTSSLNENLYCQGAACIIEAKHFCICSRGIGKQHSVMVTSSLTGKFRDAAVRQELFSLIGK